ncbi:acyl-CoA dehydrogenase family protein [Phenylobacterium sp.]|uniref:acyl-CoA dehydrogenase family protein n=1 Tax=Phenylobacterium sp. TaxID=1871053 RepID=UPI00273756BC|nr:acyl-CoA dehydrogenase family protein [Phenylobacterium sp.]MDP3661065.1 acyl-CoA dehydrogenase family protein [Phenylobacterium sp.]
MSVTEPYMTEERRMIRASARAFTEREVTPIANRLDPIQGDIPLELIEKIAEAGYFGILIPEEYGGLGLGVFEYCLIAEELARGWMSVASLLARGNSMPGTHLMSEAQRQEILPQVASGRLLGALAMSEPDTGSDLSGIKCKAVLDGEEWVITGQKYWCTFADGADYLVVVARTEPDTALRHRGLSAFRVDKPRGEMPNGVSGAPIPKIGYFGWKTWDLSFDGCRIPESALIGKRGEGFYVISKWLESARAHTAARALGLASAALDEATAYAQTRIQFERPISEFQAIRFKIAQMATEIAAARHLTQHLCVTLDQGVRSDMEAGMAKLFATEMAERVTSEAMQILGGAGYTTLFAVSRHWRDARLTKIFEGTSEIQLRIISDNILGKENAR